MMMKTDFSSLLLIVLAASWTSCNTVLALSTVQPSQQVASTPKKQWQPKVKDLKERRRLRAGIANDSELIGSTGFHHIEFYCGEAKSTSRIFSSALGMSITGSTGQHTGNDQCVSYALQSNNLRFLITAPYSKQQSSLTTSQPEPNDKNNDKQEEEPEFDAPNALPGFVPAKAHAFFAKHGLAARAVGVEVKSASDAFHAAVENGAKPVAEPTLLSACPGQTNIGGGGGDCELAEVELYGDVVLRFISFTEPQSPQPEINIPFLPHLAPMTTEQQAQQRPSFGLQRIDHAVGNVPNLAEALDYVGQITGFHEFAEFTPEDIGTTDSGLNSVVLASDSEHVLFPINEPTEGKRKSQILTYLEQNEGPGLQHLALKTDDIFETIAQMRRAEQDSIGFELMRRPSDEYYRELPDRLGDQLTPEQYERLEELGILADADDEGILLQVFTKPIGDRPTLFFEIIQRIGCQYTPDDELPDDIAERPGCGGFGQGNFRELFKSIEDYEKTLKV